MKILLIDDEPITLKKPESMRTNVGRCDAFIVKLIRKASLFSKIKELCPA